MDGRCWLRSDHVVCAQDREHPRRAGTTERTARVRWHARASWQAPRSKRCSSPCSARFSGAATRSASLVWRSAARSAGTLRSATTTRSRSPMRSSGLWPHTLLGWAVIGVLAGTNPAALPVALLIAGGLALAVPMAVVTAAPGSGAAACAHRHRPAAGRDRPSPGPAGVAADCWFEARCLTPCAARAGCCARCASTMATPSGGPPWIGFYGEFVRPGDLAFDIGAHVGDRIGSFRRLGARVVAVEPQPALVRTLRLILRTRSRSRDRSRCGRASRRHCRIAIEPRQSDSVVGVFGSSCKPQRMCLAGRMSDGRSRSTYR